MPEYLSPGVYVEEVDRGPKPIEGVGTTTASFIILGGGISSFLVAPSRALKSL